MPSADGGNRPGRLVTLIAAIGIDNLNEWKGLARLFVQNQGCTITILDVSRVDDNVQHEAEGIDEDLVFDPFDFFACIIANHIGVCPPFEADRTL